MKEQLISQIKVLEIKAAIYSETDWLMFESIVSKIKALDMQLLTIMTEENAEALKSKTT